MRMHKGIVWRVAAMGIAGVSACLAMRGAYADAEPVRGRVGGMYHTLTTRTPQFPFRAFWQVNPSADRGSGSDATPSTNLLDADELASLPSDAFRRTAYLCDGGKTVAYELTFSNLTPGADYLLEFYLNEPYMATCRTQRVQINGENVKDANGDDQIFDPTKLGGGAAKVVGKLAFTNVTAQADGTISFSFPLAKDQPVLNVATLSGTNLPSAASLTVSSGEDGAVTLNWTAARDTLAYYVENRTSGGAWTPLAALDSSARSLAIFPDASAVTEYRIISSNGLGTVTSAVRTYAVDSPRVRYALNIGYDQKPCGWFMPANGAVVLPYREMSFPSGQVVREVDGQYQNVPEIYETYGYQIDQSFKQQITLAMSNLTANAEYDVRLHAVEPWSDATNEENARQVNILTNGVVAGVWPITAASGYVPRTALFTNVTVRADADGRIEVGVGMNNRDAVLCAVEVFARTDEPMSGDVPDLRLLEFAEGVRVVPETRHAQFSYEIESKDAENGVVTTLATAVPASGFFDNTVPVGATRWYRVRGTFHGETSAWSPWMPGARSGRSLSDALRINFTENWASETPAGWLSDAPFRVGHPAGTFEDSAKPFPAVPQGVVPRQAPDAVYQTQIYSRSAPRYQFEFPGLDPQQTYKVRLHLFESYFTSADVRTFHLAFNGARTDALANIDAYVVCGGKTIPGVVENEVRPGPDGTLRMTIMRAKENPVLRGVEFIPSMDAPFGAGRLAVMRDADDTAPGNANEAFVCERDLTSFAWTAADVVGAGDRSRILAHARLYAPVAGDYAFATTATGTYNLWVDGQVVPLSGVVSLAGGPHDIYVEHLPSGGVAAELTWSAAGVALPPLSSCLMAAPEVLSYPSGWHFMQIGAAQSPAFLRATSVAGTNWLMAASGQDMWGGTDCATFLYHETGKGPFECSFRVTERSGPILSVNTRFGIAVRSSLVSRDTGGFVFYGGVDGSPWGTARGYADVIPNDGTFNLANPFTAESHGFLMSPPYRLKMARERMGANDRYILTYTSDDGTESFAKTQTIVHVENAYVGPCAISHLSAGTSLVHYGFDELTFTDKSVKGVQIIFR